MKTVIKRKRNAGMDDSENAMEKDRRRGADDMEERAGGRERRRRGWWWGSKGQRGEATAF